MNKEIWKPILGYKTLYEASSAGRIRRVGKPRTGYAPNYILKPTFDRRRNYLQVGFWTDRKLKWHRVHKLVGESFLGKRPTRHEINHKNGLKTDNRADNLEWVTRTENLRHAYAIGLIPSKRGVDNPKAKINDSLVIRIRKLHRTYSYRQLANRFHISKSIVANVVTNRTWKHVRQ